MEPQTDIFYLFYFHVEPHVLIFCLCITSFFLDRTDRLLENDRDGTWSQTCSFALKENTATVMWTVIATTVIV